MSGSVEINCDLGEGYGRYILADEPQIMPLISSCNIACGLHAGDPKIIMETIELAIENNVAMGAHPGFPDLVGFGRRVIQMRNEDLLASLLYQISAIKGMIASSGAYMNHIKPHGALYNKSADDLNMARIICEAVRKIDDKIELVGLAGSEHQKAAMEFGIAFKAEAFIDRRYDHSGRLLSRSKQNSTIENPKDACDQLFKMITQKFVVNDLGEEMDLVASTYCIHGDNPNVIDILQRINEEFPKQGFILKKNA